MSLSDELQAAIADIMHKHTDAGEDGSDVVGEMAAALLVCAHYMVLRIGIPRTEIVQHLNDLYRSMQAKELN